MECGFAVLHGVGGKGVEEGVGKLGVEFLCIRPARCPSIVQHRRSSLCHRTTGHIGRNFSQVSGVRAVTFRKVSASPVRNVGSWKLEMSAKSASSRTGTSCQFYLDVFRDGYRDASYRRRSAGRRWLPLIRAAMERPTARVRCSFSRMSLARPRYRIASCRSWLDRCIAISAHSVMMTGTAACMGDLSCISERA